MRKPGGACISWALCPPGIPCTLSTCPGPSGRRGSAGSDGTAARILSAVRVAALVPSAMLVMWSRYDRIISVARHARLHAPQCPELRSPPTRAGGHRGECMARTARQIMNALCRSTRVRIHSTAELAAHVDSAATAIDKKRHEKDREPVRRKPTLRPVARSESGRAIELTP